MDIGERTSNIIRMIYGSRENKETIPELIRQVCEYFDYMRQKKLTTSNLQFLRYLAKEAGIPQYYNMLKNFDIDTELKDINIDTMSELLYESTLHTDDNIMLHKYQKEVLDKFVIDSKNRYFLSASTSFGKTFLVYEIIRKMKYKNVFLIFPTLALLSENIIKLYTNKDYEWVKNTYSIHTLSDIDTLTERNLFILTPERFLSYTDKTQNVKIDFLFVDEAYKLDNEFLEDEEQKENERDVAYRLALDIGLKNDCTDVLLAGPYIYFDHKNDANYNPSFDLFCREKKIEILNYNGLEIVGKNVVEIKSAHSILVDDTSNFILNFNESGKKKRFVELVMQLVERGEQVIVYTNMKSYVQSYAMLLYDVMDDIKGIENNKFISHLNSMFEERGASWCVTKAYKKGIGIHHGLVPKFIQNEIIKSFNEGILKVLVCTTTITEGINTTAKNVVVLSGKKARKPLKSFDAKNIEGRSGRFLKHYQGRIFIMDDEFTKAKNSKENGIKHKNYDVGAKKSEVDILYSDEKYLSVEDKKKVRSLKLIKRIMDIPDEIVNSFKTVPLTSKLTVYNKIQTFTKYQHDIIKKLISAINLRTIRTPYEGIQLILETIGGIVPESSDFKGKIDVRIGENSYSLFTYILPKVLKRGFEGSVLYYILNKNKNVDDAVKESAKFSFMTLRYDAVKYFGVFNIMYKYYLSKQRNVDYTEIVCLDKLMSFMEHNAITNYGKRANDLGATVHVVNYFDNYNLPNANLLYSNLDDYEKGVVDNIKNIIIDKE